MISLYRKGRKVSGKIGIMRSKPLVSDPKQFALSFASAVTVFTSDPSYYIARKGDTSLFHALQTMFPEVSENKALGVYCLKHDWHR